MKVSEHAVKYAASFIEKRKTIERKRTMQLKLTTDYAVRILTYLAREGRVVPIAEIAEAMEIPEKYLNRIGLALRNEGLITSHRGKNGGYGLGRAPESIRLYDVVLLVEGTVVLNRCLEGDSYCGRDAAFYCTVHKCYSVMQKKWENILSGVTIASLLEDMSEEEIERRIDHGPAVGFGRGADGVQREFAVQKETLVN